MKATPSVSSPPQVSRTRPSGHSDPAHRHPTPRLSATESAQRSDTIGTHSSGHPSRKISAITRIKTRYGDISRPRRISVIILGVPRAAELRAKEVRRRDQEHDQDRDFQRLDQAVKEARHGEFAVGDRQTGSRRKAPIAAASAGVARPSRIDPNAKEIRIVGGISPAKNSSQSCREVEPLICLSRIDRPREISQENREGSEDDRPSRQATVVADIGEDHVKVEQDRNRQNDPQNIQLAIGGIGHTQ